MTDDGLQVRWTPLNNWVVLDRPPRLGQVVQSITVWIDEDGSEATQVTLKDGKR